MGSRRATPDRPRQGRRQKASATEGKEANAAKKTAMRQRSCISQWGIEPRLRARKIDIKKSGAFSYEWQNNGDNNDSPGAPIQPVRCKRRVSNGDSRVVYEMSVVAS